ncbi:MAG TPA: phosphoribosyltransferase [candidate division Zixibacteria bacterium]|nr:phosphoribosyltransferase [candidate division Zixibacteria bacterium]
MIIENIAYRNKTGLFSSREQAGLELAEKIKEVDFDILYIIPNGGLPVGYGILRKLKDLKIKADLLIVKKIHVPWTTEAGMGAVTPDGQIYLNERIISSSSINDKQIQKQIDFTKERINTIRNEFKLTNILQPTNLDIMIIDDGIASGFSMLAGIQWLKKMGANYIFVGSPTAPLSSLKTLEKKTKAIFCLNIREGYSFAVADAYQNWYDVSLEEAKNQLEKIRNL